MSEHATTITARGLHLVTRRGDVYSPTSFDAEAGSVIALLGPARSGRTALLLTLSGRMRPSVGTATVCGYDVAREARAVRRLVGLGLVAGVNDLEGALTAEQHVRESLLLVPGRLRSDASALLARVGLADEASTRAEDLDTEQCVRLGIALALAGSPRVIAIDDLDHDLELDRQAAIAALLRDIAADGVTVLFTCVDHRCAVLADAAVELPPTSRRVRRELRRALEVTPDAVA